jgi:hypothetical protein
VKDTDHFIDLWMKCEDARDQPIEREWTQEEQKFMFHIVDTCRYLTTYEDHAAIRFELIASVECLFRSALIILTQYKV